MKKLSILLTVIIISFASPVYAENSNLSLEKSFQNVEIVHINVNGLVCDFCARALEKVFGKQKSVSDIDVDLDKKMITISFKQGQVLDDKAITKLIKDSGYNVEAIHHAKQSL